MSDHVREPPLRVAVFDIDGVLADVRHRLHHIEGGRRDWEAFFAAAVSDPLLEQGRDAALAAVAAGLDIAYLTGRPERCREDTVRWIADTGLPRGQLLMRRDADRRPARLIKVEALSRLASRTDIAYLVDDDPEVVAAARGAGFDVRHADWMPSSRSLRRAQESTGRT